MAAGAPAPDLTPPPPILSAPVRSGFWLTLVAGVAFVVGVGEMGAWRNPRLAMPATTTATPEGAVSYL